ncbi:FliO/MopB family protein [Glaciibacter sp. 2TAF33]|uniref:FliO/MopB family protein n=1 Tax=Glaciibacter sp. 2TAF33 TaxID=3233015 RepID=UPI003F90CB6F
MDTFLVAVRVALSLAVVLGLLWYVQRRVTRGSTAKRNASLVTVVGRQGIGQKASVVVVDVEGTRFVLGVTEQSVNVLHSAAGPGEAAVAVSRQARRPVVELVETSITDSGAAFARTLTDAAAHDPLDPQLDPVLAFRPRRDRTKPGKLGGSILSPATWQQTAAVLRQGR